MSVLTIDLYTFKKNRWEEKKKKVNWIFFSSSLGWGYLYKKSCGLYDYNIYHSNVWICEPLKRKKKLNYNRHLVLYFCRGTSHYKNFVLSNNRGRRWWWILLRVCYIIRSTESESSVLNRSWWVGFQGFRSFMEPEKADRRTSHN